VGSGRYRRDAGYDPGAGPAGARARTRVPRLRGRALLLALLGALTLSGVLASPALAVRKVNIVFGCSSITFQYAGFPEAEADNVVIERMRVDGTSEFSKEKFEFSGATGENTITLPAPLATGMHKLSAEAHWSTNGVVGESGTHKEHKTCGAEPNPGFSIVKEQEIAGSSSGFTPEELKGKLGQTVDYRITVSNTGNSSLTLSEFIDAGCDPGTQAGGPQGAEMAPGAKLEFTCSHLLTGGGSYTNVASATVMYPEGKTHSRESNKVIVSVAVEARLSLSKTQEVKGTATGFTASKLEATLGQTILYQITAKNLGNVTLTLSEFTDIYCEGGPWPERMLVPGASTVYTCSEKLTVMPELERYTNVASVRWGPGVPEVTASNAVEVKVKDPEAPATTTVPPSGGGGTGTGTSGTLGSGTGAGSTTGSGSHPAGGTLGTKKAVKKHIHTVTVAHKTPQFTG
jgi:uncharacterized repeat protein (TIGR01451 family)